MSFFSTVGSSASLCTSVPQAYFHVKIRIFDPSLAVIDHDDTCPLFLLPSAHSRKVRQTWLVNVRQGIESPNMPSSIHIDHKTILRFVFPGTGCSSKVLTIGHVSVPFWLYPHNQERPDPISASEENCIALSYIEIAISSEARPTKILDMATLAEV